VRQQQHIKLLQQTDMAIANIIHVVFQRSYQIEADLIGVTDFPPLKRTPQDIAGSGGHFYGLWRENELAAAAEVEFIEDGLELCSLVVDPAYFRQGIAGQLLGYILRAFDCKFALVETAAANQPAIRLYQKYGFTEVKRWVPWHGILKVQMRAEL